MTLLLASCVATSCARCGGAAAGMGELTDEMDAPEWVRTYPLCLGGERFVLCGVGVCTSENIKNMAGDVPEVMTTCSGLTFTW